MSTSIDRFNGCDRYDEFETRLEERRRIEPDVPDEDSSDVAEAVLKAEAQAMEWALGEDPERFDGMS